MAPLSGAALALAFPGTDADPLVWFGLTPLLLLLEGASPGRAFGLGFLAGFGFFGVLLRWVLTLRAWVGVAIVPAFLLLIAFQALYWGAFGLGFRLLRRLSLPPAVRLLAVPALWVALEFARASGPLGLPWGGLGYALHRRLALIQLAELTGVWGISFAIMLTNCLIAHALRRRRVWPLLAVGLLVIALWGLGQGLLQRSWAYQGEPEVKVALIQPNIPQKVKGDPGNLEALQERYARLLARTSEEVELIALPESILPAYLLRDTAAREPLDSFVRERGRYLLFGTLDYREGRFYNTAALLAPTGAVVGRYDKVRLVPFSTEYVPLRRLWERLGLGRFLHRLAPAELTPGRGFIPLALLLPSGRAEVGVGLGTPICFESAFPGVSREFVRNGATLLITITDDAWFDRSSELEQHFSFGVFRAIETRRYFVQVANTGLSGAITPQGRVVLRSSPEAEGVLLATVRPSKGETFYVRYGDWFAWLSVLLAGIAATAGLLLGARRPVK